MKVFTTVASLRAQVQAWKQQGLTIALVPTMGNLHAGHISLIKLAQQHCHKVLVSVFVNPLQFGPNEDFNAYPRTFETDQTALLSAKTDGVFYPSLAEMYPQGQTQTQVQVPQTLTGLLEGRTRPGHFNGVTTVVNKLLNTVQPDVAIFGQKDYQQFAVITQMVVDLALPVKLIRAPIERDIDGLALSSRNQYLNATQRAIAPKLHTILLDIKQALQSGNRDFNALQTIAQHHLLQFGFDQVDYIQIVDPQTLLSAQPTDNKFAIVGAAKLGSTRLLDNVLLSL